MTEKEIPGNHSDQTDKYLQNSASVLLKALPLDPLAVPSEVVCLHCKPNIEEYNACFMPGMMAEEIMPALPSNNSIAVN